MKFVLAIAYALLFPLLSFGQTAKILEPSEVRTGQFVRFDAEFEGDSISWLVYPPTTYVDAIDRNTSVRFVAFVPERGKEYFLRLQSFKVVEGKVSIAEDSKVFKITEPDPPGPEPGPGPDPEPDDLTEFSRKVRDLADVVGNKDEAQQVIENYESSLSAINSGAYNSLSFTDARNKIVSDLYQKNRPLAEANSKWNDFFSELGGLMQAEDAAGRIKTVSDIKDLFQQIKNGLEASL